jgi:hypothetical protein
MLILDTLFSCQCPFKGLSNSVNGLVVSRIMRSRNLKEPDSGGIESGVLAGCGSDSELDIQLKGAV